MSLLTEWRETAYNTERDQRSEQLFWADHFLQEKGVYEKLLAEPGTVVRGTVAELAAKYDMDLLHFTGVLDGINTSLVTPNPVEEMTEETEVSLEYVPEELYKNMVACKAEWLYELPQWEAILPAERRRELYLEQKKSNTVVKGKKVGRNDPCPCGSGKKYKNCCGR